MLRVGLTGGLASGKSFVGRALADLGCCVIKADEIGREVQAKGGEAYEPIVREFGQEILAADGSIDRRKLGAIVFADPQRLEKLSAIVHPIVIAERQRQEREYLAAHPSGIAVSEVAILVETGAHRDFDRVVVAACRPEQQIERAMHRDGLTREEVLQRMQRQLPLDEKAALADFVIDTSGSKEQTLERTRALYRQLRSLA